MECYRIQYQGYDCDSAGKTLTKLDFEIKKHGIGMPFSIEFRKN